MTVLRRAARGLVPTLAVLAALVQLGPGAPPVGAMEPSAVRSLALAVAGATMASPSALLAHGPRDRKVVALTFDDGYDSTACSALVDVLMATATPATFFPNAVYVAGAPALWRRIAGLGFPIGNHSTHHPVMTRLSFAAQLKEIASDRAIADRVLGRPTLSVFRPPYGAWNTTTLAAAGSASYRIVLNWDVTFADSSRRPNGSPWPTSAYVQAASRGINGSVILGHCGSRIDNAALPAVIAGYRLRGFTFVTVPELLGLPGARPMHFPPPPSPPPPPHEGDPRMR